MLQGTNKRDISLLVLRIAGGIIFVFHGWQKVSNPEPTAMFFSSIGLPEFMGGVIGYIELIGGLMLILGVGTSYAAIVLGIVIAVALFYVKGGAIFRAFNVPVFEIDLALLSIMIAIATLGSGRFALKPDEGCSSICFPDHNKATPTTSDDRVTYPENRF